MHVLVVKSFQCSRNHRIKHIQVGDTVSLHSRSRCYKFVNWLFHLNFFDPVHCDMKICCFRAYFSLKFDFPVSQFHGVRKLSQMQFRNRESRIMNHTIVRISSTSVIIHSSPSLGAWYKYWRILRFSSHFFSGLFAFPSVSGPNLRKEEDAKFFELLKKVEVRPSGADGRTKTIPEIPTIFHVSCRNPESPAPWFRIGKFSCTWQEFSFVL